MSKNVHNKFGLYLNKSTLYYMSIYDAYIKAYKKFELYLYKNTSSYVNVWIYTL